ncbi:MAG: GNAT family N-acetyltransferase [Gaiellaceae bacterium]
MTPPHEPLRFERVDSLEEVREDWSRLAELSGNVFLTWEWMAAWRQHRSMGSSWFALAGRDASGALAAIVPLAVTRRGPLRIVRLMGHGPADELGPVCAPEQRPRLRGAASRALAEADAQLFLAEQLPGGYDWSTVLDGKAVRWEASPVIRAREGGWEGYVASRSANFRQQVRARERRLQGRHEVTYRRADDPARLRADLELLFALHGARWRAGSSAFRSEPFHFEFARAALERGWLRLWFLELDGRPVAAWYGFRFGDVEAFYQSGRDPRWERESVGFVLLAHTIRDALEDGMREYRLLRGDEPYKYRFADADPGVATVATGRGVLGNAAVAAGAARYRHARRSTTPQATRLE